VRLARYTIVIEFNILNTILPCLKFLRDVHDILCSEFGQVHGLPMYIVSSAICQAESLIYILCGHHIIIYLKMVLTKVSVFPFIYLFHTPLHNPCLCHFYIANSHVYDIHIINDVRLGDTDTMCVFLL
jgi:hypothetical protein